MSRDGDDVTGMLVAWGQGDHEADSRLVAVVYEDLRRVARRRLRGGRGRPSPAPAAPVHAAYLPPVDLRPVRRENPPPIFSISAPRMRHSFVDHAPAHPAPNRGGAGA